MHDVLLCPPMFVMAVAALCVRLGWIHVSLDRHWGPKQPLIFPGALASFFCVKITLQSSPLVCISILLVAYNPAAIGVT